MGGSIRTEAPNREILCLNHTALHCRRRGSRPGCLAPEPAHLTRMPYWSCLPQAWWQTGRRGECLQEAAQCVHDVGCCVIVKSLLEKRSRDWEARVLGHPSERWPQIMAEHGWVDCRPRHCRLGPSCALLFIDCLQPLLGCWLLEASWCYVILPGPGIYMCDLNVWWLNEYITDGH